MKTPVYVFTGFLNTGKTHILNKILAERREHLPFLIQFEHGLAEYTGKHLSFPPLTESNMASTVQEIEEYCLHHYMEELWVEWNGMSSFNLLEKLFTRTVLSKNFELKKVFFISTPDFCLHMLPHTGNIPYEQLYASDEIIINTLPEKRDASEKEALHFFKSFVPRTPYMTATKAMSHGETVTAKKGSPGLLFALALLSILLSYISAVFFLPNYEMSSLHNAFTIFAGILLQALPFLTLGIITSALIQLFISPASLEKHLARGAVKGHFYALLGGFIFPVCDCAVIPIFRSLLLRNIPTSVALLFMLSSPLVNPVVIFSTYFAFTGDLSMTLGRTLIGIVVALIISLSFYNYKGLKESLRQQPLQNSTCTCNITNPYPLTTKKGKWIQFITHTQEEFFQMAPYLIAGTAISVIFQVYMLPTVQTLEIKENIFLSILLMMAIAFLLSLCSTSDSMIARVFGVYFPAPAVLAFLLFGPLMDIKNYLLLKSLFPKSFVRRLFLTIFLVCLLASLLFSLLTGGVYHV